MVVVTCITIKNNEDAIIFDEIVVKNENDLLRGRNKMVSAIRKMFPNSSVKATYENGAEDGILKMKFNIE